MKNDNDYLNNVRHSCAHLLAHALKLLYPGALNAIGPAIENGFYQDFDTGKWKISEEDLIKIEAKMREILPTWQKFTFNEVTLDQAKRMFKDNKYKVELATEFAKDGKKLMTNDPGDFLDLCKMGHVENPSKELQHFKLLSVAGAYWRGDEKNKMLTRIYGTCFPTKEELDHYIWQQEEAVKRDHRKLGKLLDLFTFSDLVGSGLPLYTQKGALVRRLLNAYVEEVQTEEGYMQVWTPQIAKADLFKISGHYDKYKENLFRVISNYSDEEFFLKPMNCPNATQIYASRPRSYRDLPIRMTDFAMLYRDEKPGELNGLARVRSFSQDDCHIFCREDQIDEEVDRALAMTKKIMSTFGFTYRYRLSTRDLNHPEKYMGDPKIWDKVEGWAETIMKRNEMKYFDGPGEAAFYAPKMDLLATDALGREWQLSTIQIDYFMPEKFNLTYIDKTSKEERPIMIHRAILGSPERLIMILLEHFAGAFPTWLSPVQVKVLPITDRNLSYAKTIVQQLVDADIRVEVDDRNETLPAKIRDAQHDKIPYMLIVGDKEEQSKTITVRSRSQKDSGQHDLLSFIADITKQIQERTLH